MPSKSSLTWVIDNSASDTSPAEGPRGRVRSRSVPTEQPRVNAKRISPCPLPRAFDNVAAVNLLSPNQFKEFSDDALKQSIDLQVKMFFSDS